MAAKRIRMVATAETVRMADGNPYEPTPVKDGRAAMRACLHMILKHTADMFVGIVEIVAEKYKIDPDEMMHVITEHPRYKEMQVDPVMHDLGYIVNTAAATAAATAATTAATPENDRGGRDTHLAPLSGPTEKPKVRVMKIKPKVAAATAPAAAPAEP
jgi:hypothetical protein